MNWLAFHAFDICILASVMACFGYILLRSHRWTGMGQDARMNLIEHDQHALQGNVRRIDRDLTDFHRDFLVLYERLMKELRAIHDNGKTGLEERVRAVEDGMLKMEQTVALLPCSLKIPEPEKDCKPT